MERLCKFTILRYVPDEVREEFINIGLLFHSPEDGEIRFQTTRNYSRVLAFDDEIDISFLKLVIEGIRNDFTLSTVDGPTLSDLKNWSFLDKATSIYVNQLQFSEIKVISSKDIEADFEKLFKTFVYFDSPKNKRITDYEVRAIMNRVFRDKAVYQKLNKNVKLDIDSQEIELDYAYKTNNKFKIIKTFSFDYSKKRSDMPTSLAKEWSWNFQKIKHKNDGIDFVAFVYLGEQSQRKSIDIALKILNEVSETVDAKREEEIQEFADRISNEIEYSSS